MAGAPIGNTNSAKGRRWSEAIDRAMTSWPKAPDNHLCSDSIKGLNGAAFLFVTKMMEEGNLAYFREFGDRIDGKAIMSVENADGTPILSGITVTLVKPD